MFCSKLYWVDAWNKTIMISNRNGRNADTLVNVGAVVGQNAVFGLAVPDSRMALVSTWNMVSERTYTFCFLSFLFLVFLALFFFFLFLLHSFSGSFFSFIHSFCLSIYLSIFFSFFLIPSFFFSFFHSSLLLIFFHSIISFFFLSMFCQGEVLEVDLATTAVRGFITNLGKNSIFSVAYVADGHQPKGTTHISPRMSTHTHTHTKTLTLLKLDITKSVCYISHYFPSVSDNECGLEGRGGLYVYNTVYNILRGKAAISLVQSSCINTGITTV